MGHVFKAIAPDGTEVAVKMVKADLAHDRIFRRRFAREARIARSLDNPHVVPVLDDGEHDGIPYLVQRFVVGGSLEQRLEGGARLSPDTAAKICADVAAGLDALHEFARRVHAVLVHRDVKPGNILFNERGEASITDFGLAKDTRGTVLTEYGQILGTLDYLAPEQIRNRDVGAPTDVYGLGCVMYECLAGGPPFGHLRGTMRVLGAHLGDLPTDPTTKRPDLPPEVASAVLCALEKEPAERPQSAGELARMLQAAAGIDSAS
jgi:serine/threonine-protein kinase